MTTKPRYILFVPSKNYLPTPSQEAIYIEQGTYAFVVETKKLYFSTPAWEYVTKESQEVNQIPANVLASITLLDWVPHEK